MIARPVTIGGLAFFANAPFGQVVALPHLLLSWVDCMRLTLMTFIKPPSRAMQLGGLLVRLGAFVPRVRLRWGRTRGRKKPCPRGRKHASGPCGFGGEGLGCLGTEFRGAVAGPKWLP